MIKHNIIVIEFKSLYQILSEIKDNFFFDIKNYSLKNINEVNLSSSLILSKFTNKDHLVNNLNVDIEKIIFFLDKNENKHEDDEYNFISCPFYINDLIDKINIQFIKKKYSDQSQIKISAYVLDLNSRIISSNNKSLKLTEKEVEIILFLKNNSKPQKVESLQSHVWKYSSDLETHTVETHIYRLRKKIKEQFNDEKFILSYKDGYSIE